MKRDGIYLTELLLRGPQFHYRPKPRFLPGKKAFWGRIVVVGSDAITRVRIGSRRRGLNTG